MLKKGFALFISGREGGWFTIRVRVRDRVRGRVKIRVRVRLRVSVGLK